VIGVGFLLTWAGYGFASWGYTQLKGWDITLREWFSPLHPYTFPSSGDAPGPIPDTQVWAGDKGSPLLASSGGGGSSGVTAV